MMTEEVRIDKYLWSIRVYKTRTDATDACKGGKVRVNGADTKPSKAVRVGDVIVARKGAVTYTYKVIQLIDKRQGAKLVPNYAENLTPPEELAKLRAPVETFFLKRDRGAGRPTKKDRRQMESLWSNLSFDVPDDIAERLAADYISGYDEDFDADFEDDDMGYED
ncbi:MAG: RNA-binding S4 domain-containing protein [Bacteroidales bacterium]|nr:RNA-binding S4 domain-containing protein [Bacteroidales bacterium]MBQ2874947.1 RNA-binding S4 domain-containing protein [Bacteroidales bacterium]